MARPKAKVVHPIQNTWVLTNNLICSWSGRNTKKCIPYQSQGIPFGISELLSPASPHFLNLPLWVPIAASWLHEYTLLTLDTHFVPLFGDPKWRCQWISNNFYWKMWSSCSHHPYKSQLTCQSNLFLLGRYCQHISLGHIDSEASDYTIKSAEQLQKT